MTATVRAFLMLLDVGSVYGGQISYLLIVQTNKQHYTQRRAVKHVHHELATKYNSHSVSGRSASL